jgi:hypothetical protein
MQLRWWLFRWHICGHVDQKNSIYFFPRRSRASKKSGKVPLIVWLNIDGLKGDRVVKGVKIDFGRRPIP